MVDVIRDGMTAVTALAHLPSNDPKALAEYDVIVVGVSRINKENSPGLTDLAERLADNASRLIIYSPNAEGSRTMISRTSPIRGAKRAESLAQLAMLVTDMQPASGNREQANVSDGMDTSTLPSIPAARAAW